MLDRNEIIEAIRLLSLEGHYYYVQRFPIDPDLFGATVIAALYRKATLTIQTTKKIIKLSGFEDFRLFPDGGIRIFQKASDDRPALEFVANHMDDDYLIALNTANSRLGREERTWPDDLEAR